MLTYPTGVINQEPMQGSYVPRDKWFYFSTPIQANQILAAAKQLFPDNPSIQLVDGLISAGIGCVYPDDNPVKAYQIQGTIDGTPGGAIISEWCGDLFDRLTNPVNSIDKLKIVKYTNGRQIPSNPSPKLYIQANWGWALELGWE